MNAKSLWQVSVATSVEAGDAVAELLGRVFGRAAATYVDAETKATAVSVYCEQRGEWYPRKRAALQAGLKELRAAGLKVGSGRISVRRLSAQNWADSWKRHFKPIEIGARLLVKPGWVRRRPRPGQAVVTLDPGLSFGTGRHPTTAFCLKALVKWRKAGQCQSAWDVGTGSGILAIAASKLGYGPVEAMDFDAVAVRVARENARRNRVRVAIRRQDVAQLPRVGGTRYSVICANLTADLLLASRRRFVERLAPGGVLVLAGILRSEFERVAGAFERAGLELVKCGVGGEWRSGAFVSPAPPAPAKYLRSRRK